MLKSLQMKLVLILMLLEISVMAVVGTFLINSVTSYNIGDFQTQMTKVFTPEFILTLEKNAEQSDAQMAIKKVLMAHSGSLGLDEYRNFYILDGKNGKYLAGSDDALGAKQEITPNMTTAMNGEVGQEINGLTSYFDVAIPVETSVNSYIVAVVDSKQELNELTWSLFSILMRALMFGLAAAVGLSFVLSKTITHPVQTLTKMAARIAKGDFTQEIMAPSEDEIGKLSQTFGEMARVLEKTLSEIEGERNKLNTLFVHMADGMVAFDNRGKILHMNPAAQGMMGIEFSENMTYTQVFPNLDVDESDLGVDGQYIEVDYAVNKRILKIFLAMFGAGNDENGGIMAVLHDITEQTRLDSSRREFVANVSHELRTPLTNVRGYTETLLDAGDEIDQPTRKKFLQVVYNESERMTHIVKDLLTLSQLDYGRMEMKPEEMPIKMLVANIVSAMMMEAKNQQVELTAQYDDSAPNIMGDRTRLEQVVANIISNAIKYNKAGGYVHVRVTAKGEGVEIEVADNGMGIPEEDLPRLFERFYRVDKARSREKGGTGLGLAIAREIVEHHSGTIAIESKFEQGTTVRIYFPAAK